MIEDIYVTSRMDFDEFHNGLTDLLGYDGIIAWNKAEGTQAVVFRSNQAKDIFNFKPTKNADVRYSVSVKKYFDRTSRKADYDAIQHKVFDLFSGVSKGVANDIALEYGTTVYFIDADKDGKLDWGIYEKCIIPNKIERQQVIEITNLEAAQNGRVDNQFFEKLGIDRSQYRNGNFNGVQGNNGKSVKGKSQHNKAGILQADGNKAVRIQLTHPEDVAYANAVKNGNIAKAQAMVDKAAKAAGYKIKAYHGSRYIFTVEECGC